jgi:DNA-binding transcriptional MerR regulator
VAVKIGELARRTAVSERSLRYYEEQGLLVSERTAGGHRVYGEAAVARVIRIQELLAAGLGTALIGQVLPCMRDDDGGPAADASARLVEALAAERERIDRTMADLARSREVLDEVIDSASHE